MSTKAGGVFSGSLAVEQFARQVPSRHVIASPAGSMCRGAARLLQDDGY